VFTRKTGCFGLNHHKIKGCSHRVLKIDLLAGRTCGYLRKKGLDFLEKNLTHLPLLIHAVENELILCQLTLYAIKFRIRFVQNRVLKFKVVYLEALLNR